jgi:very-short-patch-repair endonuclease
MITARRLLSKLVLVRPRYCFNIAAGFCSLSTLEAQNSQKEPSKGIFNQEQSKKTLKNMNIAAAIRFSLEDNTTRAIQELQVAARTYNDITTGKKRPKYHEIQECCQGINEVLHHLYSSSSFNSLEFPSLLDSLVKFLNEKMLTFQAVIATIRFSKENIAEVQRLAFDTSNFRVVYHLFTLLSKARELKKKQTDEHKQLMVDLRDSLVDSLTKSEAWKTLQPFESFNLMAAILETTNLGQVKLASIEDLVAKILSDAYPKATDQAQVVLMMAILSRLQYQKPEVIMSLKSAFENMGNLKRNQIIFANLRSSQIEFLFQSLSRMEKSFPHEVLALRGKLNGYLSTNLDTMIAMLNYLKEKEDKFLISIVNDELDMMIKYGLIDKIHDDKKLEFLERACTSLSFTSSFANFKTRDTLIDEFKKALFDCQLQYLNLSILNSFLHLLVLLRISQKEDLLKIADRVVEKLSKDQNFSISYIRIFSSMVSLDIIPGSHPVLEELAYRCLGYDKLEAIVIDTFNVRTLANIIQMWHFKLWLELKVDKNLKVPASFGLLVEKFIQIFNQCIKRKLELDSLTMNKVGYTFDSLLAFGYFDSNEPTKAKISQLSEKLSTIYNENMVKSKFNVLDKTHDRSVSAEEVFQEVLIKNGIKFEQQKVISMIVCDFYLPEFDAIVELDGVVHFSRDIPRKIIMKTLLKKEYMRAKGYKVYTFTTTLKDEQSILVERFNKLISYIEHDRKEGISPTKNEDYTMNK